MCFIRPRVVRSSRLSSAYSKHGLKHLVELTLGSIVAIHGLGGDAYKTWIDQSSGCLWLRDLLPKSDVFQDARVMTFGYNAKAFLKPFERAKNGNTFAFAEALLNDLSDKRVRVSTLWFYQRHSLSVTYSLKKNRDLSFSWGTLLAAS